MNAHSTVSFQKKIHNKTQQCSAVSCTVAINMQMSLLFMASMGAVQVVGITRALQEQHSNVTSIIVRQKCRPGTANLSVSGCTALNTDCTDGDVCGASLALLLSLAECVSMSAERQIQHVLKADTPWVAKDLKHRQ